MRRENILLNRLEPVPTQTLSLRSRAGAELARGPLTPSHSQARPAHGGLRTGTSSFCRSFPAWTSSSSQLSLPHQQAPDSRWPQSDPASRPQMVFKKIHKNSQRSGGSMPHTVDSSLGKGCEGCMFCFMTLEGFDVCPFSISMHRSV